MVSSLMSEFLNVLHGVSRSLDSGAGKSETAKPTKADDSPASDAEAAMAVSTSLVVSDDMSLARSPASSVVGIAIV